MKPSLCANMNEGFVGPTEDPRKQLCEGTPDPGPTALEALSGKL